MPEGRKNITEIYSLLDESERLLFDQVILKAERSGVAGVAPIQTKYERTPLSDLVRELEPICEKHGLSAGEKEEMKNVLIEAVQTGRLLKHFELSRFLRHQASDKPMFDTK